MSAHYLPISWSKYHDLTQKLAATVLSHAEPIDIIVGISRGGLTIGQLLTDFLRVPIATFTIQSYTDIQKNGELRITEPLKTKIKGKHVLLVDDISDTGKTFLRAIQYLRRFRPKKITTLSLLYKPNSVYRPDFFAQITDTWVIFPTEVTETILSITKSMSSEGKTKADIQKQLFSLGYTPDQIRFVRKYHFS